MSWMMGICSPFSTLRQFSPSGHSLRNGNVDRIVPEEVALALINFEYHKIVGDRIHSCLEDDEADQELCKTAPPVYFDSKAR